MTEIAFYANGQRMESKSEPLVVAKSRNEYKAVFTFSEDWKDIAQKTAVFRRYSDGQSFTTDLDEKNECTVPWEVLETPRFYVSAYGGDLRTMTETYVNVERSGYDENAVQSGTVPQIRPIPTDLKIANNKLHLTAGEKTIGDGVQIQKAPILLDTFTIAVGEEPVAYYSKNIVASNCRRVLIFGELRSDDETEKSRSIWLGTNTGFNFHNSAAINISATSTVYFSAEVLLIPRNRNDFAVKGKTTVGKYVYTGGTYQENVGRTYLEPYAYLSGVTVKINGANMVAGTNFNVWGLE